MKRALFGNYGVHNLGDDLILEALLHEYQKAGDTVVVFCGRPKTVHKEYAVESHAFFPGGLRSLADSILSPDTKELLKKSRQALRSVDEVVFGGGGLLVDHHVAAVFLWWLQLREVKKSKKPYEFRAQSIELRKWWSKWLLLPFLKNAKKISVRDQESQNWLEQHGIKSLLVPDLARQAPLDFPARNPQGIMSFALCQWGMGKKQWQALQTYMQDLLQQGYQLRGLAFQQEGDNDRAFYEQWFPELEVVSDRDQILESLSQSELLIGMRLHSLILARAMKVPVIGLPYQGKVRAFMKDEGQEDFLLELSEMTPVQLQLLMKKAIEA